MTSAYDLNRSKQTHVRIPEGSFLSCDPCEHKGFSDNSTSVSFN